MRKVLFVTTISGFLTQFEKNDVRILRELGCEIHYASDFQNPVYEYDEEELRDMRVITHQISVKKSPAKLRENAQAVRELKKIIDTEKIDLIHCHNPMGGVTARLAAHQSRMRPYVVYTAHGFHFYKGAPVKNWLLYYSAERIMAHYTDRIITINSEDRIRAERFPVRGVTQIHSVGVDEQRFRAARELRRKMRTELGIPQDAFHIVTAAELNDNKNQKTVIEAVHRIDCPAVYYSICGKGPNEEILRRLIGEKGLSERVRLLGYRTDMEAVLQTADCFAFPSKREGLGVAAVEALLCGVPLIVADNRGTREYAVAGKNAFVCRADHPEEFAAAIEKLRRDPKLRQQMSDACRESAMEFTLPAVGQTMREFYENVFKDMETR